MEKISSADLLTQVQGLYKSNRVYSFVKDLDHNRGIAIDLRKVGSIRTKEIVKRCPNCGRDLKNEKRRK